MISLFGKPEPTLLERLKESVSKTRTELAAKVEQILTGDRPVDPALLSQLESALLSADIGVQTTKDVLAALREQVNEHRLEGSAALKSELKRQIVRMFAAPPVSPNGAANVSPRVIFVVGVNGVGKTTTIGKVARRQVSQGRSVILAAGDTFRAAAAEQLELWAERAGVPLVRGTEGGDPSSVVFDAVQRAEARNHDLVLADTAGRLHTKVNLVEELKKIRRVADRPPGHVSEVLLVLDATTGQNGLTQARQFTDAVAVTGVVLTKLDGTAKGGIVVAIDRELGIPVKLVGLGEGPDDLVAFDAKSFVDALFD
jgi:fused signal recognition particle receptor